LMISRMCPQTDSAHEERREETETRPPGSVPPSAIAYAFASLGISVFAVPL
jgi:hypothetical protein